MKKKLEFETFTEFVNRCDEILELFSVMIEFNVIKLIDYKNYIYNDHKFSEIEKLDMSAKDSVWQWLMSYKYEQYEKNNLYSILGQLKKGS